MTTEEERKRLARKNRIRRNGLIGILAGGALMFGGILGPRAIVNSNPSPIIEQYFEAQTTLDNLTELKNSLELLSLKVNSEYPYQTPEIRNVISRLTPDNKTMESIDGTITDTKEYVEKLKSDKAFNYNHYMFTLPLLYGAPGLGIMIASGFLLIKKLERL